jgi:hypothetical protein
MGEGAYTASSTWSCPSVIKSSSFAVLGDYNIIASHGFDKTKSAISFHWKTYYSSRVKEFKSSSLALERDATVSDLIKVKTIFTLDPTRDSFCIY